jgi:hypothetical protein
MSWRGQGGKRAKGRRGDQDPELDNTAWLAELEREAAQADEDEDDWASTLRGRRSSGSPPPGPDPPPAAEPSWAPPPDPAPPDHRFLGMEPEPPASSRWPADPAPQDPSPAPPPTPDPDWSSWRPPAPDAYGDPVPGRDEFGGASGAGTEADWTGSGGDPGDGGWQPAGADTPTGAWSPIASPGPDLLDPPVHDPPSHDRLDPPSHDPPRRDPLDRSGQDPLDRPGHEPDYPALFGELYRRSAAQQDPIWEAPPAAEPLPDPGQPEATSGTWPFEEATQSWEPSDRSFIWPSDELPSAPAAEPDQPSSSPWLDDPAPRSPAPPPPPAQPLDQTAAWPSPWATGPGDGNGTAPPAGAVEPPPEDWAAAIPTDVPAARRAADPAATGMWQPDADAEPGVPLGPGTGGPAGAEPWTRSSRSRAPSGADYEARTAGSWTPSGETPAAGSWTPAGGDPEARAAGSRGGRAATAPAREPGEVRRKAQPQGRGGRQPGERRARAWPRIVAVISWIVLVMVFCWYYVFPWLERVLPENF